MKLFVRSAIILIVTLLVITQNSFAQFDSKDLPKVWSKMQLSNDILPANPDPSFVYSPAPQIARLFGLKSVDAIVYPNFRVLPTTNTTQSELSIDIHPTNGNIIYASSNATSWTGSSVGVLYGTGQYWTLDGGTTWAGFDNSTAAYGLSSGDPVSLVGLNGNFYEGFISGSENTNGQGIALSTNNGVNWTRYNAGPPPGGSSDLLDKNHMAIDKNPSSPYLGRLYDTWTAFISGSANNNQIELRWSSNNGQTWSAAKNLSAALNAGSHNQGVNVQVGPGGVVYATWAVYNEWASGVYGEDAIGFAKSTDGGETWTTPTKAYNQANHGIRGNLKTSSIRVSSFPTMAVDRSGGPRNGTIYIVSTAKGVAPVGSDPDIFLIKSTDGGTTWTTPVRVNDDPMNNGKDQYYPWCSVDQTTGALYTVWYDSRNVNNDSSEVYMARSLDGVSFENIKVSDHKFKPIPISGLAGGYQGDYIGITGLNNVAWPFWSDNSTGPYQAWTTKVTFGPKIVHTKIGNTENLAGPYPVNAVITTPAGLNTSKVKVYWGRGVTGQITDSLTMTNPSGDNYTANIPGNGSNATYNYYISATDLQGSVTTFPAGAPGQYLSFTAATDIVVPVVSTIPLGNQFRELWPATVHAVAKDNIGIDSVYVMFKLKSTGALKRSNLALVGTDSTYSGLFTNLDTASIVVGDTLYYRVVARDASAAHNLGYAPSSTAFYAFKFDADTIKPVIVHQPLRNQPKLRWPAAVLAQVTDNLAVGTVTAEYSIRNNALSGTFPMTLSGGNYQGVFPVDTSLVHAGDTVKYRIKAIDGSTSRNIAYSPATGYNTFAIINSLGVVLVVNDDLTLAGRMSTEKPGDSPVMSALGASSTLIATTLIAEGFTVDSVSFTNLDTLTLNSYDIIALSAGARTTAMFADAGKRRAIVGYTLRGGKTFVEGGEVGYTYRQGTTELDAAFRVNVLNCSTWVSDVTTGSNFLMKKMAQHTIWNAPYLIPDSLTLGGTSYGPRDAMRIIPDRVGTFKLGTWVNYPDTAGIIAYSLVNDPVKIRNLFCTFAVGLINNTAAAKNLIANAFILLASQGGIVPVELTSFNASVTGNAVKLNWATATETNNSGFSVERKSNNGSFQGIGFVAGNGTTTQIQQYSFTDKNANSGTYTYRLKQVDFDGTFKYSDEVNVDVTTVKAFALEQNYPNPFNPSTVIKYSVPADGLVKLTVYNILGEEIAKIVNTVQKAGSYNVNFDASKYSSGVYFYRLEAGSNLSVKKMILTK